MGSWKRRVAAVAVLALCFASLMPGGSAFAEPYGPGDHDVTIVHDGLPRRYRLHVPESYQPGSPMPLVVMLHGGYGGSGSAERVGFSQVADRDGFLVAYPEGVGAHWNDGRDRPLDAVPEPDDVGFIAAVIADIDANQGVLEDQVFVTGMSNGAIMAHRFACERADLVAAIAPVAGSMSDNTAASCAPTDAVAVVEMHGTEDPRSPYGGGTTGEGLAAQILSGGEVVGAPTSVAMWAGFNGCPSSPAVAYEPDVDPDDGTAVRRETHSPCTDGGDVVFYSIEGGGHTWPGSDGRGLPGSGAVTHDINATEIIAAFFLAHPKQ